MAGLGMKRRWTKWYGLIASLARPLRRCAWGPKKIGTEFTLSKPGVDWNYLYGQIIYPYLDQLEPNLILVLILPLISALDLTTVGGDEWKQISASKFDYSCFL